MHYEPITTDFILHQKVKAIKAYVIGKNTNLFVFYNIKYNDVFLEQLRMFKVLWDLMISKFSEV